MSITILLVKVKNDHRSKFSNFKAIGKKKPEKNITGITGITQFHTVRVVGTSVNGIIIIDHQHVQALDTVEPPLNSSHCWDPGHLMIVGRSIEVRHKVT